MTNWGTTSSTGTSSNSFVWHVIDVHVRRPPPPPRPRRVMINAFAILGLPPAGCSIDMSRKRYRELAKVLHPDAGGDVKWMAVLNRAYDAIRGKA